MTSVEKTKPKATKLPSARHPGPVSLEMVIGEKPQPDSRRADREGKETLERLKESITSIEQNAVLEKLRLELMLDRDLGALPMERDVVKELIEEAKR